MTDFFCALTLRFFICGFFGDMSCFSPFDDSRILVLGDGVTGRGRNNEGGRGEVEGRARSVGVILGK